MKTKLPSLSAFIPCFNEEQNVSRVVGDLERVLPEVAEKYEIIVVDDGSRDKTNSVAQALATKNSRLRIVAHDKNRGYGASLRSGFEACQYDWIFFTDGDGQFSIDELKGFVPYAAQNDAVIGFRTKRADGAHRVLNAWLLKIAVDIIFRLHVKDIDCAFKLLRASKVKKLQLHSTGALISTELLYRFKKMKVKIKQLPVTHLPRLYGTPTGSNWRVIAHAMKEFITLYWRLKFGRGKYA